MHDRTSSANSHQSRIEVWLRRLSEGGAQFDYFEMLDALCEMARQSTLEAPRGFLSHPDRSIRSGAGEVLLEIDGETSLEWVLPLLKDPDGLVRYTISEMLCGANSDHRAVDALIDALANDPDSDVRHNAATALGSIGDHRALTALRAAAENDHAEDFEGSPVSSWAQQAIETILASPQSSQ